MVPAIKVQGFGGSNTVEKHHQHRPNLGRTQHDHADDLHNNDQFQGCPKRFLAGFVPQTVRGIKRRRTAAQKGKPEHITLGKAPRAALRARFVPLPDKVCGPIHRQEHDQDKNNRGKRRTVHLSATCVVN